MSEKMRHEKNIDRIELHQVLTSQLCKLISQDFFCNKTEGAYFDSISNTVAECQIKELPIKVLFIHNNREFICMDYHTKGNNAFVELPLPCIRQENKAYNKILTKNVRSTVRLGTSMMKATQRKELKALICIGSHHKETHDFLNSFRYSNNVSVLELLKSAVA